MTTADRRGALRARLTRLGKRAAPRLSALLPERQVEAVERYLQILRGRGSGAGWDLEGEAKAEARLVPMPEPVVVNVGANRGQWARQFMALRPGGRYVLVEPSAACGPALDRVWPARTVVVRAALGAESGSGILYADVPGSGAASLYRRKDGYLTDLTATSEPVALTTLAALAAAHGLSKIDLLKMDCEGSELAVLTGAGNLLAEGRVGVISFEFGSSNVYSRVFFRDFWELLVEGHGYRLHRVLPGGRLVEVLRYDERLEHFFGVSDYLAFLPQTRECAP